MSRYAIINRNTNLVENLIEYETSPSVPPAGFDDNFIAIADDISSPGWRYENGVLMNPSPPQPPAPAPAPSLSPAQILAAALIQKGVVTQEEINNVAEQNDTVFYQLES